MPQVYSAIKNHRIHVTTFSGSWPLFDDQMENESGQISKILPFLSFPDQKNVYFDMPQVYSAIGTIGFTWPPFLGLWPLFDDHMECEKWSNVNNIAFFEFPHQTIVCFDMPQVFSAIKNHSVHVTPFFGFMTTIWWPHGVWKVVKFQKHCLLNMTTKVVLTKNICIQTLKIFNILVFHTSLDLFKAL